jgi:hypothetical protein
MKKIVFVLFLFSSMIAGAQTEKDKLTTTMKEFHQAMVQKNSTVMNQHMDEALSFGHSNGWIQTKTDMVKDFESGLISYQSIKEDSVQVAISGDAANIRFLADINVTLRGNTSNTHIKVLEVWVKRSNRWILFARQAVR